MEKLYKCERCPSCNQVITSGGRGAIEKHSDTVQRLLGYSLQELKTKTKTGHMVYARQYFWLLLVVEDDWSFPRAARATGHDHTTVMYGVRKIAKELLGLKKGSSIAQIVKAYWLAAGFTEEFANEKAQKRKRG